jgi:hypothetical protein
MSTSIHWLLDDPEFSGLSTSQLKELLEHPSPLYRARAISVLAFRSTTNVCLLSIVVDAIQDPKNLRAQTIGILSVSKHGIAALLASGNPAATQIAQRILDNWSATERETLTWWLKTEGFLTNTGL